MKRIIPTFSGCGDDEKAYIKLITEVESFNKASKSDRDAVLVSAGKGISDLRKTWPKVSRKFDELKLLNDLPKLRKSRTLQAKDLRILSTFLETEISR